MKFLYTNQPPLRMASDQDFQKDCLRLASDSDELEIAVGYVSQASLKELARIVDEFSIRRTVLTMGMYFLEGIPARTLRLAQTINADWMKRGIGEIRLVKSLKYHGKVWAFRQEGRITGVIVGSANLSAIKTDSATQRQYEVSALTSAPEDCAEAEQFLAKLRDPRYSANLAQCSLKTIAEANIDLEGDGNAVRMPSEDFRNYRRWAVGTEFLLPLKAPAESEKFDDDSRKFTKSNINVCYAAPRSAKKPRDWYEIQFTVPVSVRKQPGYPEKNKPFFVITDDGYLFKVHTTSDNNKQFSACGDELTLGRWLKGRIAAAGLVDKVENTQADAAGQRRGMITQEILSQFGSHNLALQKTSKTIQFDGEQEELSVWLLSFKPDSELEQAAETEE